ncbi:Hypothetical protein A7982_07288 [Minicystis rosea]|nr:Hypothetical protein A7982_07288 [Minicystis rosea]
MGALSGCKKKSVCGPYLAMNLPGVTKIDRCEVEPTSGYGIGGETTASGADLVKAIAAGGFEIGRDGDGAIGEQLHRVYIRKDGQAYYMFTDLKPRPGGNNFFSIVPTHEPKSWLPEASWQTLLTARADRQALIERLRAVRPLLADPKAPAKCDASLGTLDPELAKAPNAVLVNLDARDFMGRNAGRGPALFVDPIETDDEEYRAKVQKLVALRADIDRIAARRVVPMLTFTEYRPVKKSGESKPGDTFDIVSGGEAKFDIAVVDLKEPRLLCRSKGEASLVDKAKGPPKGAPTLKGKNGKGTTMWLETIKNVDLNPKIQAAAFAELGKMSDAFVR